MAERIAQAAGEVAEGRHDDQFPIDVFQTGSGTSTHTNANEVIANLAGEGVHPNDHVNFGQSSNDVFPSAVHLAALDEATNALLPALEQLEAALAAKAQEFADVVKSGRTHLMDAVPVTLGQEFGGYAAQIRLGARRVRNALPQVAQIPLGGTATGTGLNTHPEFAERVRALLSADSGLEISAPEDAVRGAVANRDALVELSGALKVVAVSLTKIANDLALMGSGPRAGIGEIFLPELQKGSSIMPGKVNPVACEVVLQVGRAGHRQRHRDHRRRHAGQLRAQRPRPADRAQPARLHPPAARRRSDAFSDEVRRGDPRQRGGHPSAAPRRTLASATALNRYIGYDKGTAIVKEAAAVRPPAARGRARARRRRGHVRKGDGPAADGRGRARLAVGVGRQARERLADHVDGRLGAAEVVVEALLVDALDDA